MEYLLYSLNQAIYESTEAEDCVSIDNEVEIRTGVKEVEFIERYQQSDEEKDD